jgi:hypothetical protein
MTTIQVDEDVQLIQLIAHLFSPLYEGISSSPKRLVIGPQSSPQVLLA